MAKELIKCPECGAEFELSQAISRDIEEAVSKKYVQKMKEVEERAEKAVKDQEEELEKRIKAEKKKFGERERELTSQMDAVKKELEKKAREKARSEMELEISDIKAELDEKNKKLEETQKNELALRKKQRELKEKEEAMELELARKLDEEKAKILEESLKRYEDEHRLKDAEKDKKLEDMKKQIDELKRKAEQASQQSQGEVLELEIENLLKDEFPFDEIEEVKKGQRGGDVIHHVRTQSGRECGKILWETKRTKTWSDSWLQKVKDDQRDAKADIAVIVSEVLPKGLSQFRMIDGVWVTSISSALSLALALRVVITQVSREKQLQCGKKDKMELVYAYLTGPEFKNRVEAIVESFVAMKQDLDKERRSMNKMWDKREKQIERVIFNIGGMQGDVEGLAGMSLPKIETLELPGAEDPDENE